MYSLMIVDDEAAIREGMMGFDWAAWGFRAVASAPSGRRALALMAEQPIDLVITDIRMPAMDGLELSRQIQASHPDCVVVILTGYREFEYAQTALKAGVFDYLLKPLDMSASAPLFQRVRAELDARHALREALRGAAGRPAAPPAMPVASPGVSPAALPPEAAPAAALKAATPSRAIRQAIEYIERHYGRRVTLQEVAGSVYLNASYFSALFKQQAGVNFVDYLTRVRMEHAMAMLAHPEPSIAAVAEAVGYQSPQYFADSFRRFAGMSPQQFRKLRAKRGGPRPPGP
ncbi:MAG: response regulator [Clostridiales bacterium]|nr:response regulator [Clostridiales bacterium]